MKAVVIELDLEFPREFSEGTFIDRRIYTLLGRGERRCGVHGKNGRCREPAAILVDFNAAGTAMCARCYEQYKDPREPDLAEMRKDAY